MKIVKKVLPATQVLSLDKINLVVEHPFFEIQSF